MAEFLKNARKVQFSPAEEKAMTLARTRFMNDCPFYAAYFYRELEIFPTRDCKTLATDGKRIFLNPDYFMTLNVPNQVFALAHEVVHAVCRDPQRMNAYMAAGEVSVPGLGTAKFDPEQYNEVLDYVRNAMLIDTGVGVCNPDWLFDPDIAADDLPERIYVQRYKDNPPDEGGGGSGASPSTYGSSGRAPKNAKGDPNADDGRFDNCQPPPTNPATGKADEISDAQHKEAMASAASAAKAMGKLPANIQKMVDELLEVKIPWQDKLRLTVTGSIGDKREDWATPNRRRIALQPLVIMPGHTAHGCDNVTVVLDTSGSIYADPDALAKFWGILSDILADVEPSSVTVIQCDAAVQKVQQVDTLDEATYARAEGVVGGGGTAFGPAFEWLEEHGHEPDTLVFLTDLEGSFPAKKPGYPVIWCSIEDHQAPFGEVILIKD